MDPIDLRLKNAAKEGTQTVLRPEVRRRSASSQTLEAAREGPRALPCAASSRFQGRGVASGFWFNIGGETCVDAEPRRGRHGPRSSLGTPDIGGSRASLGMMAAESLGIPIDKVRPMIADTSTLGYTFLTGGSRATFANGVVIDAAAKHMVKQLCERAAKTWDIAPEAVIWEDGEARPSSSNAGDFEPLSLEDLARNMGKTGGPIVGQASFNVQGAGPSFGTHIVDVEVDRGTGRVEIKRYTAVQDAGKAIHPSYVEGQIQGGAVQGIGWALNEEYIYGDDGKLQNAGFLDYRIPVCSDVPMIEAVIVEVPNPNHPYGARGVGETPIIPPMAAIANAVEAATGIRFAALPMSPPRVLAALDEFVEAAE